MIDFGPYHALHSCSKRNRLLKPYRGELNIMQSVDQARWPELTLSKLLEQELILRDKKSESLDDLRDTKRKYGLSIVAEEGVDFTLQEYPFIDLNRHLDNYKYDLVKYQAYVNFVNELMSRFPMAALLQKHAEARGNPDEKVRVCYFKEWAKRLLGIRQTCWNRLYYLRGHNDTFEYDYYETRMRGQDLNRELQQVNVWLAYFKGVSVVSCYGQNFAVADFEILREQLIHVIERAHAYEVQRDAAFMMGGHSRLGSGYVRDLEPGVMQRITTLANATPGP